MPRIYLTSDVHLEHHTTPTPHTLTPRLFQDLVSSFPSAEILILAGDIGNVTTGLEEMELFLNLCKEKYPHVLFVAGNHEYYDCGYDRKKVISDLETLAEKTRTIFLHRKTVTVEGIKFTGATLWSLIEKRAYDSMNDSRRELFHSHLEYAEEFFDDYRFLRGELEDSSTRSEVRSTHPHIVITHHLPTTKLVHPRFAEHPASTGFYTNLLDSLPLRGVSHWFCGHTHERMECKYGDTVFAVNPMGYPGEKRVTEVSSKVYTVL